MAKPSSKKVTRAARTTGGRTARGATPWGWYSFVTIVVVLGTVGVYTSRTARIDAANKNGGAHPKVNADHWHAAIGVYQCDHFAPNIKDSGTDPHGIHTHGDGVVHIHPFDRTASGENATLKVFADTVGMKLTATSFRLPGDSKTYQDGETCKGKPGHIEFYVNGKRYTGNPAGYHPKDRDLLVLAFVAKGTKVPTVPPSAPNLDKLTDVASTTTTAPAGGASTTTSAPAATTTTSTPAK
jgi:hypothetical protein